MFYFNAHEKCVAHFLFAKCLIPLQAINDKFKINSTDHSANELLLEVFDKDRDAYVDIDTDHVAAKSHLKCLLKPSFDNQTAIATPSTATS